MALLGLGRAVLFRHHNSVCRSRLRLSGARRRTYGPWEKEGGFPHFFPLVALATLDPALPFLRAFCLIAILHCGKKRES